MVDESEHDRHSQPADESGVQAQEASSLTKQSSSLDKTEKHGTDSMESSPTIPLSLLNDTRSLYVAQVNPDAIDALAHNTPEQFLHFLDSNDKRLSELNSLKENNRHNEEKGSENTKRIALGTILLVFIAVLVYAAYTGNGAFAKDLMASLFIGLGGIGIGAGLKKSQDDD